MVNAKLYVIGAVSGIENNNIEEFERVRELLWQTGAKVDIPHEFIDPRVGWNDAMLVSINRLTRFDPCLHWRIPRYIPEYSGIALLDGWENSRGARLEKEIAEALGIPCKPWYEWLEN